MTQRSRIFSKLLAGGASLVLAISVAGAKPKPPPPPPIQPSGTGVLAYYEAGDSDASLNAFYGSFNQIATDSFTVKSNGTVSGKTPKALAFAQSKNMASWATVSNFGKSDFDPKLGHSVVASSLNTQRFIKAMMSIVSKGRYTGVNIDFEGLVATDRAAYTTFISKVAQAMHASGYLVMISVPAKLEDDPTDSWSGAFNFAALAPLVDYVQLMTYDENGPWGDPGPVAGLDWVEASVQYAVSVIPAGKVSLGMPAYGYDWNLTAGTGDAIAWADVNALIASTHATPQWDAGSSSPWFNYTDSTGKQHVVWYENPTSIQLKSKLVVTYSLAGVSVWVLGDDDASFWQAVHAGGF